MARSPRSRQPAAPAAASIPPATANALAALGLTPLEAEAYRFVLSVPQATGYRIAQALGKPVGNIYKTIESLEAKGAIMSSDDDGSRVVTAVPAEEWIRARRAAFEGACADAGRELARFEDAPDEDDDRVYHLVDAPAAIERARSMLAGCRMFALLAATPRLVPALADGLRRLAKRGVPVACKVFAPCPMSGVEVVVDPRGRSAVDEGPGEWLVLTTDGRAALHALFRHAEGPAAADGRTPPLHLATYTTNPLLAWSLYSGLSSDLLLASLRGRLAEGADQRSLRAELDRLAAFESPASAGKASLARRFRSSPRRQPS